MNIEFDNNSQQNAEPKWWPVHEYALMGLTWALHARMPSYFKNVLVLFCLLS